MTTSRVLLCLTLLCGATYPSPAAVIPLEPPRSPLALLRIESESQHYRNPFDEHLNLRVNSDNSGQVQNEEQACISPIDGNVLVAVWRDFRLGYRRVGVGYSHDNGLTWHDELFPQMFQPWQSDPTLVVDGDGTFTANVITFDNSTSLSDLIQVSSYDGGTTWQDTVWAAHNLQPPGFEDKQMLAVDVSGSPYHGTFYCSWSRFYNYPFTDSLRILLTYKRPGEDYSDPIILSTDESVQWSNVCVGAEGQVYVSWIAYDVEEDGVFLKFARSLNGGETWTPEQTVVPTEFFSANVNPDLLIFSYGALACDVSNGPHRGRLYMIYTDATPTFDETDIWFMYSDDDGETWTDPLQLDDAPSSFPVDQFHPWITVDDMGNVWAAFYDRRNDPDNLLMDLYFTVSEDGGQTWSDNERITTVSCDPGAGTLDAGLIGEYIGWNARGGKALAVWTDTRLGNQDVFSSIIDSVFIEDEADDRRPLQPSSLSLSAFPNPTNGAATIRYSLAQVNNVQLALFDVTGRLVKEIGIGERPAGDHQYNLNFDGLATGIYFAELKTANESVRTKLMLLK